MCEKQMTELAALYTHDAGPYRDRGLLPSLVAGKRKAPGQHAVVQDTQHLPSPMSAGGLQPSRLAAWDSGLLLTASHKDTYMIKLEYPDNGSTLEAGRCEGVSRSMPVQAAKVSVLPKPPDTRLEEIQSIGLHAPYQDSGPDPRLLLLGSVDSRGTVLLRRISAGLENDNDYGQGVASVCVMEAAGQGSGNGNGRGSQPFPACGWAGLAFHPTQPAHLATVRSLSRCADFRDGESCTTLRTCPLWYEPSSLCFLSSSGQGCPLLAVAESHVLSLWDFRASEQGGCVGREASALKGLGQHVWALSTLPRDEHGLLLAGREGTFLVYDVRARKMRVQLRSAAKHDLLHVLLSAVDPLRVYVAGMDNEFMACTIGGAAPKGGNGARKGHGSTAGDGMNGDGKGIRNHAPLPVGSRLHQTHTKGLRADARWAGMAMPIRAADGLGANVDSDELFGVSVAGTVYCIRNAQRMPATSCRGGSGSVQGEC